MIIDIHVHVTRVAGITRSVGDTYATPEQLIKMMDAAGIDKAVLLPSVTPECMHVHRSPRSVCMCSRQPRRF